MAVRKKWTEEEEEILIKFYNTNSIDDICKILKDRKKGAIMQRVKKLRLEGRIESMQISWKGEKENFIIDNYENMKIADIAKKIDVDVSKLYYKISHLKEIGLIEGEGYTFKKEKELEEADERKKQLIKEREIKKVKAREEKRRKEELAKQLVKLADRKREQKILKERYKQIIQDDKKCRDYGIGKKQIDIQFEKDKEYSLEIKESRNKVRKLKGLLVQATHDHITFVDKNGIRESFLRRDILMNEIKAREV